MVDATSIETLHSTFPRIPKELEPALRLVPRVPSARRRVVRSVAARGYVGCFPFAEFMGDDFVIRILPGRPIAVSPVGSAEKKVIEGRTFSPDLRRWVAGRLAAVEAVAARKPLGRVERKALTELAAEFGDDGAVERVLAAVDALKGITDMRVRGGRLWAAVAPESVTFHVLSNAWSRSGTAMLRWVDEQYTRAPDDPILAGIFVSLNVFYETGADVTEAAWRVIASDAAFDFTYDGISMVTGFGWGNAPLARAAQALKSMKASGLPRSKAVLLRAARAFARDPEGYDGAAHLAAARAIAKDDPPLAYTHAANAAAFHARAGLGAPSEALRFALDLAARQGWKDLVALLEWSAPAT